MTGTDEAVGAVLLRECGPARPPAEAHALRSSPHLFGPDVPGAPRPARLTLARGPAGPVVRVEDGGGRALLVLGPFPVDEAIDAWRGLADGSGLSLDVETPDGCGAAARLQAGPPTQRRRLAVLNGRRPRFLVRRKAGRPALRPRVHREAELTAGR